MTEAAPPPQPSKAMGCLATGGGIVLGLIATVAAIGVIGAAVANASHGSGRPAGVTLIALAAVAAFISIAQLRRDDRMPFLQGVLIGAASASLLIGICGALLVAG